MESFEEIKPKMEIIGEMTEIKPLGDKYSDGNGEEIKEFNQYNFSELFSECLQNYSENLLNVVKKSIESDFETKEIVEQVRGIREIGNYERKTTLTDSFNDS